MPHNGAHVSCCAVVRGLMRNVFFVPREEVASPEIAALAAAAESDPAAKKQLIPLIHVSAAPAACLVYWLPCRPAAGLLLVPLLVPVCLVSPNRCLLLPPRPLPPRARSKPSRR